MGLLPHYRPGGREGGPVAASVERFFGRVIHAQPLAPPQPLQEVVGIP